MPYKTKIGLRYQYRGKIGTWTDIYACGATFYLMITGKVPPPATDRVLKDDLIQPSDIRDIKNDITSELNEFVLHSLAVKIEDRLSSNL